MKEEGNYKIKLSFNPNLSFLIIQDIAMAKAILAENKDSPGPLKAKKLSTDERVKAFSRWDKLSLVFGNKFQIKFGFCLISINWEVRELYLIFKNS